MAFFIPPVFLFGNNANRFHNDKEKKAEYKTAKETEIKIKNREIERIVELEEENKKLKEDSKSLESTIGDVVRENRRLKEENKELRDTLNNISFSF